MKSSFLCTCYRVALWLFGIMAQSDENLLLLLQKINGSISGLNLPFADSIAFTLTDKKKKEDDYSIGLAADRAGHR